MKISLEWLSDYLPGPIDPAQAAEALTHGGLPVEVIEKHGDDAVLDVEVTSNRADCLSHQGVARELAALLNRPLTEPAHSIAESGAPVSSVTSVEIKSPELCPHYTARVIRNVKIAPSPDWMRRRLEAIGLRCINNVVDVTNYVMFEMGQPLHAFDFDKLGESRIVVRNARHGETLVSIDGHERKLMPDMLVIADAAKPVALAGVMGGRDSEVSDATVNVLLESARFDPLSVRTTSRRLALKSDSSYRFERGIDPTLPLRASARAVQLILQTAGGQLLSGVAQDGTEAAPHRVVSLRLSRLNEVLGVTVPPATALEILKRLGLSPAQVGDRIDVRVPSWRADINIEVDLVEEVGRVFGYQKIPVREEISIRLVPPEPDRRTIQTIRQALVGGGFFEAITVTFVSDLIADAFKPRHADLARADSSVRKADARLRPSLLPGLLEAVARNESAGSAGVKLFETGSTFTLDRAGKVAEERRLGLVGDESLRGLRGVVESLLTRLDATRKVDVAPAEVQGLAADACGQLSWNRIPIGHIGMVDAAVCGKLDLRAIPAAAELNLDALIAGMQHVPQLIALPKYPAVRRDLSFVISDTVRFSSLRGVIDQVQPANLESVEYVGSYRGKPLEKGQKSVTISLVFRSPNETLTSQAVDSAVDAVVQAARKAGAVLRR